MILGSSQIRSAISLALLLLAAAVGATLVMGSPALAQDDVRSELHYTVDREAAEVRVVEVLTLAQSYGEYSFWIPQEASGLRANVGISDGESDGFFRRVVLATGGARTVEVSYVLKSSAERQSGAARVNDSFAGFQMWPSEGTDLVTVTVPAGFGAGIDPTIFAKTRTGEDQWQYESTSVQSLWGYWFIALSDSSLVRRQVDVGVDVVEIAGWAGDDEWLDFAEEYVGQGIPTISRLTGQPWPESDLEVVESVAPAREGYGGWYSRRESQIEVSDTLDSATLLHELSHAWFNGLFYDGRWMIEGFAEEFASAALFEIDGTETEPTQPGPPPKGFTGLAEWRSRLFFEDNWDEEYYGYDTSWYVIDALSDEIGRDGMAATLEAMLNGRQTYALDGEPVLFPKNDWRRFLDMLELHGNSATAEDLFREHVVPISSQGNLDERRSALESYEEFSGGDHSVVPLGIRDAMARWRFADVDSQIASATIMTDRIDALELRASALDASLPRATADLYLASDGDFQRLEAFVQTVEQNLAAVERDGGFAQDADLRNFELGRFELMNVELEEPARDLRELNLDADSSGSSTVLPLVSVVSLAIVAFGVFSLTRRLKYGEPPAPPAPPSTQAQAQAELS